MAKTTTTRAPRRSAEQIARDELAMTEKKLAAAETRKARLQTELNTTFGEIGRLTEMRDYQAAHLLLAQPTLDEES